MNLGQYELSVLHVNVLNVNVCVQCSVLKKTTVMLYLLLYGLYLICILLSIWVFNSGTKG